MIDEGGREGAGGAGAAPDESSKTQDRPGGEPGALDVSTFFDERPVRRTQITVFALCGALMFFDGFDTQTMSYAAPHVAAQFALSKVALGQIFSAALVGLMVGYLAISPLSATLGHKRIIFWSALSFATFSLLTVFSTDLAHFIGLRFLSGVGLGAMAPSAITLAGDYMPRRFRASSVLYIYCFFSLGFVAAGFASDLLIERAGWHALFLVGGIGPLVILAFIHHYLSDSLTFLVAKGEKGQQKALTVARRVDPSISGDAILVAPESERSISFPVRDLFNGHYRFGTILLWLVFSLNLAEFYAMQSWLPTILTDLGYDMSLVVLVTSMTTVGGIAIAFVVGPSMDRVGAYETLTALYVAGFAALCLLAAMLDGPAWILVAAAFLAGCCVSGGQKSVIALAAIFYPPQLRSTGIGWGLGIGRLGGIAGPLIVGAMLHYGIGPDATFYLSALPMLAMAAAIWSLRQRYARPR